MPISDAQRATLGQLDRVGFFIDTGEPCECGDDADYSTTKRTRFSEYIQYTHRANCCQNRFTTYIEG
jgi:hypothetical protein